jgi:hypothetical protein
MIENEYVTGNKLEFAGPRISSCQTGKFSQRDDGDGGTSSMLA